MPDKRCCPSCGRDDRVLVIQSREGGFKLSCSMCAFLSDRLGAHEAFFKAWGAADYAVGHIMDLEGVPHWSKGAYVESVPLMVINNGMTAMVTVRKDEFQ